MKKNLLKIINISIVLLITSIIIVLFINNKDNNESLNIICKKATTLHTKICEKEKTGCGATIGKGNTITYGTLVNGTPKAGDAYDCKLREDGDYTERFYYVTSDGDKSILIYYKNINDQETYAYDLNNQVYHGPETGYLELPSINEWNNNGLIAPGKRQIVEVNDDKEEIKESITYKDKAARLLTIQEVQEACGNEDQSIEGYLDNCNFLMENVGYYEKESGERSYGYWLESPRSISAGSVWGISGVKRYLTTNYAFNTTDLGIRPVITVKTSDLE